MICGIEWWVLRLPRPNILLTWQFILIFLDLPIYSKITLPLAIFLTIIFFQLIPLLRHTNSRILPRHFHFLRMPNVINLSDNIVHPSQHNYQYHQKNYRWLQTRMSEVYDALPVELLLLGSYVRVHNAEVLFWGLSSVLLRGKMLGMICYMRFRRLYYLVLLLFAALLFEFLLRPRIITNLVLDHA